jgi:hypothetical protein
VETFSGFENILKGSSMMIFSFVSASVALSFACSGKQSCYKNQLRNDRPTLFLGYKTVTKTVLRNAIARLGRSGYLFCYNRKRKGENHA